MWNIDVLETYFHSPAIWGSCLQKYNTSILNKSSGQLRELECTRLITVWAKATVVQLNWLPGPQQSHQASPPHAARWLFMFKSLRREGMFHFSHVLPSPCALVREFRVIEALTLLQPVVRFGCFWFLLRSSHLVVGSVSLCRVLTVWLIITRLRRGRLTSVRVRILPVSVKSQGKAVRHDLKSVNILISWLLFTFVLRLLL